MLIHTLEKLFFFELCKRWFLQKDQLNDHLHVYTLETPFICETHFKYTYKKYKVLFLSIKKNPFELNQCNKKFTWNNL